MPVNKRKAAAAHPRADDAKPRVAWTDLSADLLADLKCRYLEGAGSYAELVEHSGLDRFEFQKLVKAEGWGARPKAATSSDAEVLSKNGPSGVTAEAAPKTAKRATRKNKNKNKNKDAPKPADLANQMLGAVRIELDKLKDQDGTTSQDRERGSRALMQLMNTLEKAVKMHKKVSKKPGGNKQHKETLKDAENLRREIAERIERFRASQPTCAGMRTDKG